MDFVESLLKEFWKANEKRARAWIEQRSRGLPTVLYSSMDIRNAGFKLAPVDHNLFPAGFNNLSFASLARAGVCVFELLRKLCPDCKKVLLIIEDHDRNKKYFESILYLKKVLADTGVTVSVANFERRKASDNQVLQVHGLVFENGRLKADDGFDPDLIILNNDLTIKPEIIGTERIVQPIFPSIECGWFNRRKSNFFEKYTEVTKEFCTEFDLDPWLITPFSKKTAFEDMAHEATISSLKERVEAVMDFTREKYKSYGITEEPYCFIKDNKGTYGMGVIHVTNSSEVEDLNRKKRNKLTSGKQGEKITEVLVQEGIPTRDLWKSVTAEKTLYLIGDVITGGFYRWNTDKDKQSSLNAAGSMFSPMDIHELNRPAYFLIGALSYLAAQREISLYG